MELKVQVFKRSSALGNKSIWLILLILFLSLFAMSALSDEQQVILARDGQYIKYQNGIVYDTKTGLEWSAGPDKNSTWLKAKSWVQNLVVDGSGWRMPTLDEVKSLYQKGHGSRNMTPLLKTTGWYVWAGAKKENASSWHFKHNYSNKPLMGYCPAGYGRGFAVRFRKNFKPEKMRE